MQLVSIGTLRPGRTARPIFTLYDSTCFSTKTVFFGRGVRTGDVTWENMPQSPPPKWE